MRRNRIIPFAIIILLSTVIFSCSQNKKMAENPNKLVIWTYDSFSSEWGPAPRVSSAFEEKTGIKITWVSHGDAGEILSRLLFEGKDAGADIILGLDQNLAERALKSGLFESYRPKGYGNIFSELIMDKDFRLVPVDYSYFAIVYDSEKITLPPGTLEELTEPRYRQSLVLIDPRTSSVGLGFFGWVKAVYGPAWQDYWRRLEPSILTVAEGWSSAYGLFTRGEAPMVISYTTSPGYHLEYEQSERYRAALFAEGHPIQIEAAGLLKASTNKQNAKIFLDFMLSGDFQNIIPLTNWMYPVIDTKLPDSFRVNPKSDKPLKGENVSEDDLNEWLALMRKIKS